MSNIEKAKLECMDNQAYSFTFIFNPNQLDFNRSISLEQSPGSRTEKGMNKTSFKHPNPYTLTISNILIENYESGGDITNEIDKFKQTVEFLIDKEGVKRPPLYIFHWSQDYLKCFVKSFKYKITQFKSDGKPIRAFIDLTLEEIDLTNETKTGSIPAPKLPQRQKESRSNRSGNNKNTNNRK